MNPMTALFTLSLTLIGLGIFLRVCAPIVTERLVRQIPNREEPPEEGEDPFKNFHKRVEARRRNHEAHMAAVQQVNWQMLRYGAVCWGMVIAGCMGMAGYLAIRYGVLPLH